MAYPILSRFKVPATIFLVTGFIDSDQTPWFTRLTQALVDCENTSLEWKGTCYSLMNAKEKAASSTALEQELKKLPHPELERELNEIVSSLTALPLGSLKPGSPFRILDRKSLAEMLRSGLIEFGAHTHSHAILSLLPVRLRSMEIDRSLKVVEALTEKPCQLFAYPNGRLEDYDQGVIQILEQRAYSGPNRPLIPIESGHLFRGKPAGDSGAK